MDGTFAVRAVRTLLICSMLAVSSVVFAPPAPADAAVSDDMMLLANQMRYAIGAPTLVPDSRIVAAAQNHANYSSANGQGGHFETAGLPYYTGYSARDRVAAMGSRPRSSAKSRRAARLASRECVSSGTRRTTGSG